MRLISANHQSFSDCFLFDFLSYISLVYIKYLSIKKLPFLISFVKKCKVEFENRGKT